MKDYRVIANHDRGYNLKETTFGTYKKIKLITLRSTSTSKEEKEKIIREFRLDDKDIERLQDLEAGEFYLEMAKALFIGIPNDFDPDELNIAAINKALLDFFMMLNGN